MKRIKTFRYSQFECLICILTINKLFIQLIVLYRPPPSQENQLKTTSFLTEWADFISNLTISSAELVIMGDVNMHLDNTAHPPTRSMMHTLESCNLTQYVNESTYCCGHTLMDVLIGRHDSTMSDYIIVQLSSHNVKSHCVTITEI